MKIDSLKTTDSQLKEKKKIKEKKKNTKKKGARKPLKKEIKQRHPSIWQQLSHLKSASDEQLARFYTGVITGDVKDFTGLEASIDTKLKAAKFILEINAKKKEDEERKKINDDENKKDATLDVLNMLKNRVSSFEKEVFGEIENEK